MQNIIRLEIVFYNKHTFIIYLKITFIKIKKRDISFNKIFFEDKISNTKKSLEV